MNPGFKLDVKISGDGGKMSRITNFVVISFSVLNDEKDVMSSKGIAKIHYFHLQCFCMIRIGHHFIMGLLLLP